MSKSSKSKKQLKKGNQILYIIAMVVIALPLLLLAFIYFATKENAGAPTFGDRFDASLDPEITEELLDQVETSLAYEDAESVEINLKSATLRITFNMKDDTGSDRISAVLKDAYKKVNEILPVETYFTNKESMKMYDLDIHAYNFIPQDDNTEGWVYKELIKNAASEKAITDTLSAPRDKETSDILLGQQEALKQSEKGE